MPRTLHFMADPKACMHQTRHSEYTQCMRVGAGIAERKELNARHTILRMGAVRVRAIV
jgi:hypothetical protein